MKKLISISALLLFITSANSQFKKNDAINWLNAKMEDAKGSTPENGELIFSNPIFLGCTFENNIDVAKIDFPEPKTLYTNTLKVELNKLSPKNIFIHSFNGKFYYDVYTTNSKKVIPVYFFAANEKPYLLEYSSKVRIGPFREGQNLEKRVKDVIIKLILSCGGKSDSF
jgi:hypothetical protein